jgi:ATP-binding protein involved in chromosome partitioning
MVAIGTTLDSAHPLVESEPDGPHAAIYRVIGAKVREQLEGVIATA